MSWVGTRSFWACLLALDGFLLVMGPVLSHWPPKCGLPFFPCGGRFYLLIAGLATIPAGLIGWFAAWLLGLGGLRLRCWGCMALLAAPWVWEGGTHLQQQFQNHREAERMAEAEALVAQRTPLNDAETVRLQNLLSPRLQHDARGRPHHSRSRAVAALRNHLAAHIGTVPLRQMVADWPEGEDALVAALGSRQGGNGPEVFMGLDAPDDLAMLRELYLRRQALGPGEVREYATPPFQGLVWLELRAGQPGAVRKAFGVCPQLPPLQMEPCGAYVVELYGRLQPTPELDPSEEELLTKRIRAATDRGRYGPTVRDAFSRLARTVIAREGLQAALDRWPELESWVLRAVFLDEAFDWPNDSPGDRVLRAAFSAQVEAPPYLDHPQFRTLSGSYLVSRYGGDPRLQSPRSVGGAIGRCDALQAPDSFSCWQSLYRRLSPQPANPQASFNAVACAAILDRLHGLSQRAGPGQAQCLVSSRCCPQPRLTPAQ